MMQFNDEQAHIMFLAVHDESICMHDTMAAWFVVVAQLQVVGKRWQQSNPLRIFFFAKAAL